MGIEHDGLPILLKLCIPYKDALMIRKKLKDEGKDYDMPPSVWYDIVKSMEIQSGVRNA